jgi:hypothetical protein
VALALAGAAVAGWGLFSARYPERGRPLTLVISGDTAGWIVPCGCTSNQSGGLLRRATYVRGLRERADVILADAGGAPGGTSPYHRFKFEAILRGEHRMGLDAHNLGGPEAALGAEYLRKATREAGITLLSANVRDGTGALVGDALQVWDRSGRRIALAGVLSRRYGGPGLTIDEPREALLRAAADAKGRYDSLVVLAYMPEDELRQLAADLPEADAIVGGPTGQSLPPRPVGPTLLAAATNKGKFLVRLDETGQHPAWSGEVVEMGPVLEDDPEQRANLSDYLTGLAGHDFAAADTGLAPSLPDDVPARYRLAGDAACAECHREDRTTWNVSKHAGSWRTLAERDFQVDPACQQCHTTGFGLPGGFVSAKRSAAAKAVGCESCHGPSAAHAKNPKERTLFAAADQCVSCHDRENSPQFGYDVYWPRIRHGARAVGGQRPHGPSRTEEVSR